MISYIKKQRLRKFSYSIVLLAFIIFPLSIMGYKLYVLDYPLASLIPVVSYQVELSMTVDGHGNGINMRAYLPQSDSRQIILEEENSSGIFNLLLQLEGLNKIATWHAQGVQGQHSVRYGYSVQTNHVQYVIPPDILVPESSPQGLDPYLRHEEGIQVDDPLIAEKLQKLFPDKVPALLEALTTIHRDLQDNFENKDFSGYTDALTALKLGEASCNGKSRLFAALARKLNIPTRLVGGIILEPGTKRVSHQWVELYVNGHWIPFDTINDHFAEIPANYLTLYIGDQVLFKHTANVNYNYFFKMIKRLVPRREAQVFLQDSALNVTNLYGLFERVGISQNLLKIILMIPFGALITVIFRNVIGLQTFGTFLPALIAVASRETGLFWGVIGFILIIGLSLLVRMALEWMQLLHSPKMGVMLTTVVIVMMSITVIGVNLELFDLAHVTLFPIAILAITTERFAIIEAEQGLWKATQMMFVTLIVVTACYVVMDSHFLQSMALAFPETLFIVIALNLWIGKWIGIRVSEFMRFHKLLFNRTKEQV